MTELAQLTIHEARDALRKKDFSVSELLKSVLDRIDRYDQQLGAYLYVNKEASLKKAEAVQKLFDAAQTPADLAGIPIAPKDIYLTTEMPTTCASQFLKDFMPPYNSHVIDKLLQQNAILVGKTNLDEFAMGATTENSSYKITRNPWDLERIPGGSSGGSAVAVSADLCLGALGTDTGGSIRQPSSHCSLVGLKPTYGRVSRYGVVAFSSSLDQMGPMAKDVEDAAILLQSMAGHDPRDSTSLTHPVPDYSKALGQSIKGLKVGVPVDFFEQGVTDVVKKTVRKALEQLQSLGAELIEVAMPHTKYTVSTYYIIAPAEASANLARFDGVRYGERAKAKSLEELYCLSKGAGFGPEVKRRVLIGTYVLSSGYYDAYYVKAQKARTLIRQDYLNAFEKVDVIAGPVSPHSAYKMGEEINDPLKMYCGDILTIGANLAGLPGMSVPCGFDEQGMPIGMQIIGPALKEEVMLKVAHAYEQSTEWHLKKPSLG